MRWGSCSILLAAIAGCRPDAAPPATAPALTTTAPSVADQTAGDDNALLYISDYSSRPDERYHDYERRSRHVIGLFYAYLPKLPRLSADPQIPPISDEFAAVSRGYQQWRGSLNAHEQGYQSALGIEAAWLTLLVSRGAYPALRPDENSPLRKDGPARKLALQTRGAMDERLEYLLSMAAQIITLREGAAPNAVPRPSIQQPEISVPEAPVRQPTAVPIHSTSHHRLDDPASQQASQPDK